MNPSTRSSARPKSTRHRHIRCSCVLAVGLLFCYQPTARAQAPAAPPSASSEADAPAADPAAGEPLAPLPEVPSQDLDKPSADQLEQVQSLLDRVVSSDPVLRERAVRELLEAEPKWVPAISHSLDKLADATQGEALKRKLLDVRDKARSAERERMKSSGKRGKVTTPDYMEMLGQFAEPKDDNWRAVTKVVALSRMLGAIATTPAVRELIRIYVRYGEFLRVDTQLQLEKLGDKALPALIEARRHQAPKIARWAEGQLDSLGKAIASEAVQTPDPDVLADVLRAYGYSRDPDAARVVISFANSERPQVREAARQAVALMKEVANWPLRDTYSNIVGKKPPADWAWDRTARELFGEFDRLRLAQVYKLFAQGTAAQRAGDLPAARAAFDKVLARSPLFSRRSEMLDTYVSFAESQLDSDPKVAEAALRRARRLSADGEVDKRVESLLWLLEGQDLVARGVADQVPFRRALELNPDNQRARDALAEIQRGEQKKKKKSDRFLAAGVIGAVALLAIAVIALRRGSPVPRLAEPPGIVPEPEDPKPDPADQTLGGAAAPIATAELEHFPKVTSAKATRSVDLGEPGGADQQHELAAQAPADVPAARTAAALPDPALPLAATTRAGEAELDQPLPATPQPTSAETPADAKAEATLHAAAQPAPGQPQLQDAEALPAPSRPQSDALLLPNLPSAGSGSQLKLPPIEPSQDDD